jgi:predicted dienelactone hydrolase
MKLTALLAAGALALSGSTFVEASTTVDVKCAALTYHQAADWFFPSAATPKGLVYLQHGFSRSNGNMADLAEHYAAAGFLVFAPTLPSTDLFGAPARRTSSRRSAG